MIQDETILRAFVTGKTKEFLTAHPDWRGTAVDEKKISDLLQRRVKGEPLAYILGFKEFYGRKFRVSPDVLIPRPETEFLVDIAKELSPKKIVDVGTGSGCIAISLALELPKTEVEAVDLSEKALVVAEENSLTLGAKVRFYQSDLLDKVEGNFDLVVANLPYVSRKWEWTGPELAFEPEQALFTEDEGLAIIKRLIEQIDVRGCCKYLLLELDSSQKEEVGRFGERHNFNVVKTGVQSEYALLLEYNRK